MKKFIYISGIVVINIFVFGALFKVQHWPGANILITSGLSLFCFCFLASSILEEAFCVNLRRMGGWERKGARRLIDVTPLYRTLIQYMKNPLTLEEIPT